jgi:hypothetical protein
VAVKGKMNVRTKILINECIVEQVNYPNFMWYTITVTSNRD